MATSQPIFRFAPSPNGYLHLGHAYSALQTAAMAEQMSGNVLLRMEDIDQGRRRQTFVDAIFDDLTWLGLTWPKPVLFQSDRFAAYRAATAQLEALGVLYPCAATRSEIGEVAARDGWARDPDGAPRFPNHDAVHREHETQARVASGAPHAVRIDIDKALAVLKSRGDGADLEISELDAHGTTTRRTARPEKWGDAVLIRKDCPTSYHLAVVVDDAFQGVTHVSRGRDLFDATDIQRVLQGLLNLPAPIYFHHPLILDDTGKKLSKSANSTSIRNLRELGWSRRDVLRALENAQKCS